MTQEHVWRALHRPELGLCDAISDVISKQEWLEPALLTSVRLGPALLITSDYGGRFKGSRYESLSYLVADLAFCWLWDEFRKRIRKEILQDSRAISYKKLTSDKRRARALVPFLRAANTIPGLLSTFLIDTRIASYFSEPAPEDGSASQVGALSKWKEGSFGKLSRIGQLGAMLVSCLSAPGQDLLWITDRDEIAPNLAKLKEATKIIGHYLNHYSSHSMGRFQFGTTDVDNGSLEIEDLAALPDLAAGALSEVMTQIFDNRGVPLAQVHVPLPKAVPEKAHAILGWLADDGPHPLKKIVICVDQSGDTGYKVKFVSMYSESPMLQYDWRPEFREYVRDKIIIPH
jgi:hypothetical protein